VEIVAEEGAGKSPPSAHGLGREMAFINHFYFYLWDSEWGGAFWKTNAYAPFPVWLWLNGHEWAKRQLDRAGIAYEALDNGFRTCSDAAALQEIRDRLGSSAVQSFFTRWSRRLPSPFTDADQRAGYGYQMAFRQSSRFPILAYSTVRKRAGCGLKA
jgi:hypothetical protein